MRDDVIVTNAEEKQSPWYNLSEDDRIKKIYSQFTIKDFWGWWSNNEQKYMEVRIKNFDIIKQTAIELQLPFSASGIYVCNDIQLKQVIGKVRNQTTIWFGVNPRKRNYNLKGWKCFEGKDTNVQEITYITLDIDRIKKEGPANNIDLENCDKLSNLIIERLATQGWGNNYIKICSGNGVQLLVKLDFPIKLPEVEFNNQTKSYIQNNEFDKTKQTIPKGIGQDILRFSRKYIDELGVEVDKACFNISRVCALPFTKNYKYDGFTWRGIIEIQNGINVGLSDYVLSKEEDVEVYKQKNVFTTKALKSNNRIRKGKLKDNILIKFMLENNLPYGMINNYLWYQLKILLRDSGVDFNSEEFKKIHQELENKYKGKFTLNIPDSKFNFDENIVNKYCIENMFPPLYPLWPKRTKRMNMLIDDVTWEDVGLEKENYVLQQDTGIIDDLEWLKKQLEENNFTNIIKFKTFINGCKNKYGEEKTKYYFDNIMKRYLIYT